jgi:hypothetical protein
MAYKDSKKIDFRKLSKQQLAELSDKWYKEALVMERLFETSKGETRDTFFRMANTRWKKVHVLEKWRLNNNVTIFGQKLDQERKTSSI